MKLNLKQRKKDRRIKYSLFSIKRFIFAFFLVGFIVTVNFLLFFNSFRYPINDIVIANTSISYRALITLGNVLFISTVFSVIDSIRRRIFFGKPLERILNATHEIAKGNFKVRIKPFHGFSMRDEFDVIIEDFNKMAEELEGNQSMKNAFIADVSHEFKTPLSVIQNYSTMIQEPDLDEEQRSEYARILCLTSRTLSELVSNILKLNKLENQQIFSEKTTFNLSGQLCECMLYFENILEEKDIIISLDLDEDLNVTADYELLIHVWNNLFSNAIKFNKEGGKIFIGLKKEGKYAVVTVADTGCGMKDETKAHIFEKFYQGDSSRSTNGNGLGLSLVKRVVDIMNGKIAVESIVGEGSTFTVSIPIE